MSWRALSGLLAGVEPQVTGKKVFQHPGTQAVIFILDQEMVGL